MRRLSVFEHRCLRSVGKIWWNDFVGSSAVGPKIGVPGSSLQNRHWMIKVAVWNEENSRQTTWEEWRLFR